jgi:hypothetical protein
MESEGICTLYEGDYTLKKDTVETVVGVYFYCKDVNLANMHNQKCVRKNNQVHDERECEKVNYFGAQGWASD